MKVKIKRTGITILLLCTGVALCIGLYQLFDKILNGVLLSWLDRQFVSHDWVALDNRGNGYFATYIMWWRVKEYLFRGLIAVVIVSVLVSRWRIRKTLEKREKQMVSDTGKMIEDYMKHDRDASAVFPPVYAEISTQLAEIKGSMQRHEQALKEEASRKNDLITYLAHDLKTPLTSVVGYLSLLEEAPDMPEPQKEKYIHITLDKALRLEKLINEFFEITRYNLQQIVLEEETVDLGFMLLQMADEFYPILNERGNTIRVELPKTQEEITLYADAEKLARVFNNILKNAVAYSYAETEILVECLQFDGKVQIRFQNRGKTIPEQKLQSIFEKFFRLDDARATNSGGAGLGLAIAKEIVTLHGGQITAESENEVTTFVVELPG